MNRRNFLTGLATLIGGVAIESAIPFNRVYSFPSNIVIPSSTYNTYLYGSDAIVFYKKDWMEKLKQQFILTNFSSIKPLPKTEKKLVFYTYQIAGV